MAASLPAPRRARTQHPGAPPPRPERTTRNTMLHTWFERDRKHVELRCAETEETIVEWWDDAVDQAIDDGFLPRDAFLMGRLRRKDLLHAAAVEYANEREL